MSNRKDNSNDRRDGEFASPAVDADVVRLAFDVMQSESRAIAVAASRLDNAIVQAVQQLMECRGRVIVTGMGKMGCIARKAAATFCSTGTPAVFLHPSEAVHGDLGIVSDNDIVMVLSNSGETREIIHLLPFMARLGTPVIGLTGNLNSTLATRCKTVIDIGVESEADPISVSPTSSTTVALAMCDAIAVALMHQRGFTREQFAIFHPGGHLGGRLLIKVADLMHVDSKVPQMHNDDTLRNGIAIISNKGLGAVIVVSPGKSVVGIVTDGDLRRIMEQALSEPERNLLVEPVSNHMCRSPITILDDALAAEALRLMEDNEISILPVVDKTSQLVGVVHLHDLIRAGLA